MTMPESVRADRSLREVVRWQEDWIASPAPGVERRLLDRVGGEVALATSIVRYAPGASFDTHVHDLGEEFFVLDGCFVDEHGAYEAGTYVRNPPGSRHAPSAPDGCTIFVKLRHFHPDDGQRVVVDTRRAVFRPGLVDGLEVLPLHEHDGVSTALVRWAPGTRFKPHHHWGGEEILVLEGTFCDEHGSYPAGTWMRSPHLSQHWPFTEEGCLILVKVGHLG